MSETVGQRIEALARAGRQKDGRPFPESPGELAELFGVSFETLRKWRLGITAPSRARALFISGVLGVPVEVFMLGVRGDTTELTPEERKLLELWRAADAEGRAHIWWALQRAQPITSEA